MNKTELKTQSPDGKIVDHLDELRKRLIVIALAVLLSGLVSYLFSEWILEWLTRPIRQVSPQIFFFSPHEAFLVRIKTALFTGVVVSSPVIFYQVWLFAAPGLLAREKKWILPVVAATTSFFVLGAVFALYAVMPVAIRFLLGFETAFLKPMISITEYMNFLISMTLAFGIAFNLPVVITFLSWTGLVRPRQLKTFRPYAVLAIFIVSSFLTPPDVISQILLALPLVLLYEVSILASHLVQKKRQSATVL